MQINRKLGIWIGIILVIAAILAAGWYFVLRPYGSLMAAWNSLVNPVAGSSESLNASGTVETTVLTIAPEITGKILEVDFQEGDLVKAGAVLVHLDDSTLKIQRNIASANLESAKLTLLQLAAPTVLANLQKSIAQDGQAIDDAQQALDTQKYFINNTAAIVDAQAKLYLAKEALDKAQTMYDKIKDNNLLSKTDKAVAYQTVYASILAYDNAHAVLDLLTGVPNQEQTDLKNATLALAKSRLAEDQAFFEALNGGTIPDNATGTGIAQLEQAKVNVDKAQATLDLLDDQISKMAIIAPVDGVVMTRSADPGNVVNPGTELLTLARPDDLTITVYIPQDSLGKIKLGQTATVSVDPFPNATFHAVVDHISDTPQFLTLTTKPLSPDKSTVYAIQLVLQDGAGKLKPGMPADVSFNLK